MSSGSVLRPEEHLSPSPPAQPLSKRDKRRSVLQDKLSDLASSFTANRDAHYRQQLSALQLDMQLIVRAEPYTEAPLADGPDEIVAMIDALAGNASQASLPGSAAGLPGQRRLEVEAAALKGRWHARFAKIINDALEDRDAAITMLHTKYQDRDHEINVAHAFGVRVAREEHRALSSSIHDRLTQTVSSKRGRLQREKDQLEITDSHALLLHPSQYSLAHPSSPGGVNGGRKTRNTRHRPGEPDDANAVLAPTEGTNKRKRKAPVDEPEHRSPAPANRRGENGAASPYHDTRAGRLLTQKLEAPLYSVERLFTEKELAMHGNTAAVAAAHYFAKAREQAELDEANSLNGVAFEDGTPATNGGAFPAAAAGSAAAAIKEAGQADGTRTPVASEMERVPSRPHHATRAAGRNGANSALNIFGDAAASEETALAFSFARPYIPQPISTKNGQPSAPGPSSLGSNDAQADLEFIQALGGKEAGATDMKLLRRALRKQDTIAEVILRGGDTPTFSSTTTLAGGVPMSVQSSAATFSDAAAGGVAMTRNAGGSSRGVAMKRTASGAGIVGGNGEKRAKNR
ncbi:MAG: hypothetical protein M1825_005881 [Sarcosagium campestre]|nr:MAG: hypothetical protein M1825_005881 [Sarcosagium campestre]